MMTKKKKFPANDELQIYLSSEFTIANKHEDKKSILTRLETNRVFVAQKQLRDTGIAAFLKKRDSLFAGTALNSALAAQKQLQEKRNAAFLKSHDTLVARTALNNALLAQKQLQDISTAAFLKTKGELFSDNYFATNLAKKLEKLNERDFQTLHEAIILFSRSPQGAAIIATNIHEAEKTEPDASTRLKNYIEESPLTSSFRKLPLFIQIIIIHFLITMNSIIDDKSKEMAIDLIEYAQQYVNKAGSPRNHIKQIKKQLPDEVDVNSLKHIRIITAKGVRLRKAPSMKGEGLFTIGKYTPVIVIDKSNRSWLYVQLSYGDQKIYGWVNRSYTKVVKN